MKKSNIQKIKILELILLMLVLFFVSFTTSEIKTFKNLDAQETAYFDFSKGAATLDKNQWDISFNKTTIEVKNGGQVIAKNFDELKSAPKEGYIADSKKAVPAGSGNGWYKYSMMDHSINPLPGKTIVVKTSDHRYVKVEILSYYKDQNGDSGYYTFRYQFIEL